MCLMSGIFVFLPVFTVSAANISVMIIETGRGAVTVRGTADVWEDNLMDTFFQAGHIVTNARSRQIEKFPMEEIPEEALRDLQAASEGGAEFFIIALLGYGDIIRDGNSKPETIALRLYQVSPYNFLSEETIVQGRAVPFDEAVKRTRNAVHNFISQMRRKS
jgi:hypothetical protein